MHISNAGRWIVVAAVVAGFIVSGLVVIVLVRNGAISGYPWESVGTALAIFGALCGLIAGIAQADIISHQTRRNSERR
ncbi:hypothetical protein [Mumia zhuanghuii]|uniref:Uncharacterized protein n=1 Tax=Mumia zhuanghuii TaxID=2585211 RepID=A0A5C4MCW6_9ACTN|nr:hypothetical protein [Mumia zhuanghuii]TNC30016.1 hypothetical protein FHE65_33185 [Mumia zhuanghuii]TNC43115.1 hypothetical protein FHE65_19310 [Mumia zhuanghuii]